MVKERLYDIVYHILLHVFITDKEIPYHGDWNVHILPRIGLGRNDPFHIDRPLGLPHLWNRIYMANEFYFNPGGGPKVCYGCSGEASHPEEGINLSVLQRPR